LRLQTRQVTSPTCCPVTTKEIDISRTPQPLLTVSALLATLALSACGGGDEAPSAAAPAAPAPAPASTTVTGSVVKGPVAGAQVCGYSVVANGRGTGLGSCTTTDASGNYTLTLPAGSGPLWVEATGGSYTDEITAAATALPAGSALRGLVTANGSSVISMLTPLTTLALNAAAASAGASGTLDSAAFNTAATQLLAALNLPGTLNISTTQPTFGSGVNSYGTALTAISRMVANGLTLAQILASSQPSALAAAYAVAANPPVAVPVPVPVPPVAGSAPLVITGATPAGWNGTLDMTAAQFEHGSSASTGAPYTSTEPYCRVAAYGLLAGGDGKKYFIEIPFRKDNQAVGLARFGDDATLATLARTADPTTGIAIDTMNRRITFTNFVIGGANSIRTLTLNGTLDYPTNVAPENRAACG